MKTKKTALLIAAIIALTTVMSACNIKTGTNDSGSSDTTSVSESTTAETTAEPLNIPPMTDVEFSTVIAKNSADSTLDITYGEFYKEYMFYLKRNKIEDDTAADVAQTCMEKRQSIVQYLINEKVLMKIAKEKGFDQLTEEELNTLETTSQANIKEWQNSFSEDALALDSTLSGTVLEEKCAQLFEEFLAECDITTDDLLMWDRSSAIINKLYADTTKDIKTEQSEAEDYVKNVVEQAKTAYENSPSEYEESTYYESVYIPEGSKRIKHILIQFDEETTNKIIALRYGETPDVAAADKLRKDSLAPLKAEADEVMAKLDAGEEYDTLIETYNDDKAMSLYYPDGYLVTPKSTRFVDEFIAGANSLEKIGDYTLIETDYGYHILKYASDAVIDEEAYKKVVDEIYDTMQSYAENEALSAAYEEWMKPYDYETNYDILRVIIEETATAEAETTAASETTVSAETTSTAEIAE